MSVTSVRQGVVRHFGAAALGLTLRERAAVRAAHKVDTARGSEPGRWLVACSCGWGTEIRGGVADASELFGEHLGGWMIHTAQEKARMAAVDLEIERALVDGHPLTRERFGAPFDPADVAEADADVVSIARPAELWRLQRPGAVAHLIRWQGKIAACGIEVSGATSQDARAYNRKCDRCAGVAL